MLSNFPSKTHEMQATDTVHDLAILFFVKLQSVLHLSELQVIVFQYSQSQGNK